MPATEPSPFDDGELYDILCQDLTYGIDFYRDLARAAQGPVLDVCCGTGRVLLPCLQAGAAGDGLDLYQPMLDRLATKAMALGLRPNLYRADMSDFTLPRRYALVMITFNAFIHNLTQDAQIRCLACCRRHLAAGGLLAFDTFFPDPSIVGAPPNTRVLEGEVPDPRTGQMLRVYDTRSFDRVAQTQRSLNEIESVAADGTVTLLQRAEFTTRYFYKQEMALLLKVAGFTRCEIFGDFDRRPLTLETDQMIVVAQDDSR